MMSGALAPRRFVNSPGQYLVQASRRGMAFLSLFCALISRYRGQKGLFNDLTCFAIHSKGRTQPAQLASRLVFGPDMSRKSRSQHERRSEHHRGVALVFVDPAAGTHREHVSFVMKSVQCRLKFLGIP